MKCDDASRPKVSVVIPSIGHQPLLPALVTGILEGSNSSVEVIVSHSDGSAPSNLSEAVVLVHQRAPLLASAARNRGAEKAKGQYIFFIDDDNRVEAGVVDVLASLLDKQPQLVEVGPAMYYADDPERVYCLGASHHGLFGRTRWILQPPTDNSHQVKSDTLPNAFMVRRREFEGIGGFDEDYFPMEFEESDLAFRLREQYGGYVACSTEARIWHHAPLLVLDRLAAKSMARSYYSARNRPIFIARHFGIGQWIEFLFVGQFLAASTRLSGVCFGPNQTGRSQAAIVCAYMAGMVVGLLISVDEILRPFRSRMRLRGLRNQARRMRG